MGKYTREELIGLITGSSTDNELPPLMALSVNGTDKYYFSEKPQARALRKPFIVFVSKTMEELREHTPNFDKLLCITADEVEAIRKQR